MSLPKTTIQFLFHFVREQWIKFAILITTSLMWAMNDSLFPYFIKRIVNTLVAYHGVRRDVYHALYGVLALIAFFWIFSEILARLQGIVAIYFFPKLRASMRNAVFGYVKSHSHEYFANQFAGNIAKKLNDLPNSAQVMLETICFQFVTAAFFAIFVLVLMWFSNPIFAVILVVWLCCHMGITLFCMYRANNLWEIHSDSVSTLSGKIVDAFTNMLNVRLFSRGDYEKNYLATFQQDEINKAKKAMWLLEFMRMGLGVSGLALIFAMMIALIEGWIHGWVTIGDFTQVNMQMFWLLGWIWNVSYQLSVFVREAGTVSDALTLLRKEHDVVDVPFAKPIRISHGKIIFDRVNFSYRENQNLFQDFNLTIPAGQKVGLVGFSGSGKSTFVNLILRFYDVQSGKILIDEQNIATAQQDSLRAQIAMIPQDPALFHRTLIENIRYGNLQATDEEVIAASKLAHCHEFIEKLDEGYQSLVGERGVKLSGGQRQRIAIARAILKNAPILILDEATSSLDTVTEKLIQSSLQELMKNKTTIVVAHRLSTLSSMDRILVFHQGKIIEEGTQETLLKQNGHFAMLWNMQMNGFLPEHE